MFQKRCLNFVFAVKERLQSAPRFEVDFVLNFAMCSSDFPCFRPTSHFLNKNFQEITFLSFVLFLSSAKTSANFYFQVQFLGTLSSLFSNLHVNDVQVFMGTDSASFKSSFSFWIQRTFRSFHFEIALVF